MGQGQVSLRVGVHGAVASGAALWFWEACGCRKAVGGLAGLTLEMDAGRVMRNDATQCSAVHVTQPTSAHPLKS